MRDHSPQRVALIVGINTYLHVAASDHLRGAANDAEAMADLLTDRFRFPVANVELLCDERATRAAVLDAFDALGERVRAGTQVVLHWSGHGSQIPAAGSEVTGFEPHGFDETLVTYDARGGVPELTDKELLGLLARLDGKGANLTWIVDACHSGHLYRLEHSRRSRHLPAGTARVPAARPRRPDSGRTLENASGHRVLLAACRPDQEAFERPLLAGAAHGEWSFALLSTLKDCAETATVRQVYDRASASMLLNRVPQSPRMVGEGDRLIFGTRARPPVRYIEVGHADDDTVELTAGRVHGVMEESLWNVFRPRTYEPAGKEPNAQVRITRVDGLRSRATLVAGKSGAAPQRGDWAFEHVPGYGEMRLGVRVIARRESLMRSLLEGLIEDSPVLFLADASSENSVSILLDEDFCRVLDPWGLALEDPWSTGDEVACSQILNRLEVHARARHGLRLHNKDPESSVSSSLQAHLLQQDRHGNWLRARAISTDPRRREVPIPLFHPGELIAVEITHTFDLDLYVYVLDFDHEDSVTQLFPPPGGEERIAPSCKICPGTLPGDEFETFLPGPVGGVCFFKILATTSPTRLDWLRTDIRWPDRTLRTSSSLEVLMSMGASGPIYRDYGDDWGCILCPFLLEAAP